MGVEDPRVWVAIGPGVCDDCQAKAKGTVKTPVCQRHWDEISRDREKEPERVYYYSDERRQYNYVLAVLEWEETGSPGDLDPTGRLSDHIPSIYTLYDMGVLDRRAMVALAKLRTKYHQVANGGRTGVYTWEDIDLEPA